ncbi:MAG TPA: sugar phosphate isomerase/epimerase [Tepidisphaeraceae bacterium]|nr:sugar phosphate isomerase/epimerase [Tepidisphaeraceae bacterium]
MPSTIAAQLFTLRDMLKTPAAIAATLKKVKQIGYEAVQVSGMGKIEPKELAAILDGEGLACCATHIPIELMRDHASQVIEDHQLWKCRYTAIGSHHAASKADWLKFAAEYNAIAARFDQCDLRIGYHNHSHELAHHDGTTALQLLIDQLNANVWMEIDTYWIVHGGGDPIQWIDKVRGRIPCVHLKDMAVTPDRTQLMAEVGEGNLNWPGILAACRKAGVQWYIVEQDTCQRDPLESLAISLRNLRQMGVQ